MTESEKLAMLGLMLRPNEADPSLLTALLSMAKAVVLNRRYPFGYNENMDVPRRYEYIQLRVAVEIYGKMGAEGQLGHSENGISRTWADGDISPTLLRNVIPIVSGVATRADT